MSRCSLAEIFRESEFLYSFHFRQSLTIFHSLRDVSKTTLLRDMIDIQNVIYI